MKPMVSSSAVSDVECLALDAAVSFSRIRLSCPVRNDRRASLPMLHVALHRRRLNLLSFRVRLGLGPPSQHSLARLLPLGLSIFFAAIERAHKFGHHALHV